MNCETELVYLGLSFRKTDLGIITCKFMAYDCGGNLIRFFGTVNVSLLPLWKMFRGDREQFQQVARAGLEPGTTGLRFYYENKKTTTPNKPK